MNLTEVRPEEGRQIQEAEERLPPEQEEAVPAVLLPENILVLPDMESQIIPTAPEICTTAGGAETETLPSGLSTV